jgi:succinoglycan biosynthesis protein ExoL
VRIAYFVQDLSDPAVGRRVQMLQAGGADIVLFGFRRNGPLVASVAGAPAVDLGRTHDLRLVSRVVSVMGALLGVRAWCKPLGGVDAILARNLEMLLLARAARCAAARQATLNYELLDVHRLLVSRSTVGACLRAIEGDLLRDTDLALVSSPAFVADYFEAWSRPIRRTLVLENKVFQPSPSPPRSTPARIGDPPWRIGWYGMLRCQRSLDLLCALARDGNGLVQVDIRGRPTYGAFNDFDAQVANAPNLTFGGPYRPADVPDLYAAAHFTWAIDFFEQGLNSSWLLPNRLYEGQLFGAVPIAMRQVETGRWLARRHAGLLLDDPVELLSRLRAISPQAYLELGRRTAEIPRNDLVSGISDCVDLVRALSRQASGSPA